MFKSICKQIKEYNWSRSDGQKNADMSPASGTDWDMEKAMSWAREEPVKAQQLTLDAARLLSNAKGNIEELRNKNFFERFWMQMNGDASRLQQATTDDLIHMQRICVQYIEGLMEQQAFQAQSIITIKNNLNSLASNVARIQDDVATAFHEIGKNREMISDLYQKSSENRQMILEDRQKIAQSYQMILEDRKALAETRYMLAELAKRANAKFESIENRTKNLEISTELQGWLLSLEERGYKDKYPASLVRMLRIINDFLQIKSKNLNYNEILFIKKAIRTVGLNPDEMLSLNEFITRLINELCANSCSPHQFIALLDANAPAGIKDFSRFVLDEISSPVFMILHTLKLKFRDRNNIIVELRDTMNISDIEALHKILRKDILDINIDVDYKISLADIAVEILHCIQLACDLGSLQSAEKQSSSCPNITPSVLHGLSALPLFYEVIGNLSLPSDTMQGIVPTLFDRVQNNISNHINKRSRLNLPITMLKTVMETKSLILPKIPKSLLQNISRLYEYDKTLQESKVIFCAINKRYTFIHYAGGTFFCHDRVPNIYGRIPIGNKIESLLLGLPFAQHEINLKSCENDNSLSSLEENIDIIIQEIKEAEKKCGLIDKLFFKTVAALEDEYKNLKKYRKFIEYLSEKQTAIIQNINKANTKRKVNTVLDTINMAYDCGKKSTEYISKIKKSRFRD